jgi:hypothetical protein
MAQPFVITPHDEALCAPLALGREAPDGEGGTQHASSCTIGRPDGHGGHHTVELETKHCSSHGVLLAWAENSGGECVCVTNQAREGFVRYWVQGPQASQGAQFLGPGQVAQLHAGDTLDVGVFSRESPEFAARAPRFPFTLSRPGADVPGEPPGDDDGEVAAAPAGDDKAGSEAVAVEAAPLCALDVPEEDSPQAVVPPAPQAAPEMHAAAPEPEVVQDGGPSSSGAMITSSDEEVETMSGSESDDASSLDSGQVLVTDAAGTVVEGGARGHVAPWMEEDVKPMLGRGDSAAGGGHAASPPMDRRDEEAAPRDASAAAPGVVRPSAAMQPPAREPAPPPKRQRSDAAQQPAEMPVQQPAQRLVRFASKNVEVIDLTGDDD